MKSPWIKLIEETRAVWRKSLSTSKLMSDAEWNRLCEKAKPGQTVTIQLTPKHLGGEGKSAP